MTDHATGRVRASFLRTLAPFAARYPRLPIERILDDAQIDRRLLADPDAWFGVHQGVAILEGGARATNDASFSLAFGTQIPWRDLGVLAHVVLNSPTLGAALANACRYFGLQSTAASTVLEVEGRDARLAYGIHDIAHHEQNTVLVFTMFVRLCRDALADQAWHPRAIHFRHARPKQLAPQLAVFRCELAFDQPEDTIVIDPDDLRRTIHHADHTLLPILVGSADAALRDQERDDFQHQIRRAITVALRTGQVGISEIAARIGTSPRTMQRRLQDRGRSFNDVVAATRLELSKHYLRDREMSLTDVALLLGYSELSAFSRAFRRWTGSTALDYRKQADAPAE